MTNYRVIGHPHRKQEELYVKVMDSECSRAPSESDVVSGFEQPRFAWVCSLQHPGFPVTL